MANSIQEKKLSAKTVTADIINYSALTIIILLAWHIASADGKVSQLLLPSMTRVWDNFTVQLHSGQLFSDISASLWTVARGYFFGAAAGLVFGVLMGIFPRVNKFFSFIFDAVRQIPGIAWFPLIILWFGIGDLSKIILVARGTFFPVLVNTIEGIRTADPKYIDLVKLYQVKLSDIIFKIYVPSAMPYLCTGLRLGAGTAWMSVVAAEMLGASKGLGFRIENSQQMMQSDVMIVDILMIGILGWLIDIILKRVTLVLNRWKKV